MNDDLYTDERNPMRLPFRAIEIATLALVCIILAAVFGGGWYYSARSHLSEITAADVAAKEAQALAVETARTEERSTATANENRLLTRLESAEAAATLSDDALGDIIEKLDALGFKTTVSEEGTVTLTAPKPKAVPQKAPAKRASGVRATANVTGSSSQWSSAQVRSTLAAAAKSYGLSAADATWIVDAGARVAYRESTYRPAARNGQYLGLFQFGNAWGSEAHRLDPVWSCYRFVAVMRDGGRAKVQQHWSSTIGG